MKFFPWIKNLIYYCTAITLGFCLFSLPVGLAFAAESNTKFTVSKVVELVKAEIDEAQLHKGELPILKITSVELTLSIVKENAAGGRVGFSVPVFSSEISGGVEKAETQTLNLILKPTGKDIFLRKNKSLGLSSAIKSVKAALREAYSGKSSFELSEFTFEAEFLITETIKDGVNVTTFFILGEGNAEYKRYATQHIRINMNLAD